MLATVFSPLTIAPSSAMALTRHLDSDPAAVQQGLATITQVTSAFAQAAIEAGCAGVFFAVQEATHAALTKRLTAIW